MMTKDNGRPGLTRLLEMHELAVEAGRRYPKHRDLFGRVRLAKGKHFTGIVGPRGVGKTILLKQLAAAEADSFYLSVDVLDPDTDLFDLMRKLAERLKFRTFLLDEIHFLGSSAGLLKQISDFLDVRVVFTSSVALAMHAFAHDLSRRVRLVELRFFSYREYLRFVTGVELPALGLPALAVQAWSPEHLRAGPRFDDYLRGGLLPFALEEPDPLPLLSATLEKVIDRDAPRVLRLTVDELQTLRRLVRFVGRSTVDGVNYSSLSQNLGITKYKAEHYVNCLESAFILRQVLPAGTNVLREPKVLMVPPYRLLYREYEDAIGGLREDFAVEALGQAGLTVHYLKSMRGAKTPDYLIETGGERVVVEIGGQGKGRTQFKGVTADRKLVLAHTNVPEQNVIPLCMLGFLEPVSGQR
ncbi:MAG: ATP-binding protein [Candidatus Riflebacteria bacterium]|nr:ATP-binding protein [Candidatus Riflebacteria bacterium]